MMTPVAFGVIHAALSALDADLTPERISALDPERLDAAHRAAGDLRKVTEGIHDRLREAYVAAIITASHQDIGRIVIDAGPDAA